MTLSRALRLAGLLVLTLAAPARAADFDRPDRPDPPARLGDEGAIADYGGRGPERLPPPPPAAYARPRFTAPPPETCREFVRRRLDPDGEPVLRRVRICDEPDFGPGAERGPPPPPPPPEEIPPRRWGGPRW